MYMFSSFSYGMIAIYFSSLHQNIFLWEKLFILGWSHTLANDCNASQEVWIGFANHSVLILKVDAAIVL